MDLREIVEGARDALQVRRVYGEPYEKDGVTVIPAARVRGGGGGGVGPAGQESAGGGLGLAARPVGAFVVSEGKVEWRPAVDMTRCILGCQAVAIVAFLSVRSIVRARARARVKLAAIARVGS